MTTSTTARRIINAALFETRADAVDAIAVYHAGLSRRERANRELATEWCGSQHGFIVFIEHASGVTTYLA